LRISNESFPDIDVGFAKHQRQSALSRTELSKNAEFVQKNRLTGAFSGVFAGKTGKYALKLVRELCFLLARTQNLAFLLSSREMNLYAA
jgi:hypothetical protein